VSQYAGYGVLPCGTIKRHVIGKRMGRVEGVSRIDWNKN